MAEERGESVVLWRCPIHGITDDCGELQPDLSRTCTLFMADENPCGKRLIRLGTFIPEESDPPRLREALEFIAGYCNTRAQLSSIRSGEAVTEDDLLHLRDRARAALEAEESDQPRLREAAEQAREAILGWEFSSQEGGPRGKKVADALFAAGDSLRAALQASTEESVGADGLSGGVGNTARAASQSAGSPQDHTPPAESDLPCSCVEGDEYGVHCPTHGQAESDPDAELERVAGELDHAQALNAQDLEEAHNKGFEQGYATYERNLGKELEAALGETTRILRDLIDALDGAFPVEGIEGASDELAYVIGEARDHIEHLRDRAQPTPKKEEE